MPELEDEEPLLVLPVSKVRSSGLQAKAQRSEAEAKQANVIARIRIFLTFIENRRIFY